jgi:hypothetical protein
MLMGKLLCAMDPTLPEGDFHRRRSAQSQVKYQARAQMFNGAGCNWIVHYNRGISKLVCWGTGGHTAPMKTGSTQINGIDMF